MITIDLHGKKWVQPKMDGELEKMIFRAVIGRKVDILKDLYESGATFNIVDKDKNTPLHLACEIGMREIVQFLVERGAKMNVRNKDKKTPLHILVEKRWADLAKWRLYQGADPGLRDKDTKTPIDLAHPWLAGQMKEILLQRERAKAVSDSTVVVGHTNDYGQQPSILNLKAGTGSTPIELVMDHHVERDKFVEEIEEFPVHLTNLNSKILQISNTWDINKLQASACKAFGMEEIEQHLRIAVRTGLKNDKGILKPDEYCKPEDNVDRVRHNDWPSHDSYKFILLPAQGAAINITMRYRELMYNDKKQDWSNVEIKAPPKKETKEGGFFFKTVIDKDLDDKKDDKKDKKEEKKRKEEEKKREKEKKKEEKKK